VAISALSSGQTYAVRTAAGMRLPENIPALDAGIGEIGAIASDQSGNVYLAARLFAIVLRWDVNTGILTRVAGRGYAPGGDDGTALNAGFTSIGGVVVDQAGSVFISVQSAAHRAG
jgi:hypothetical protein